MDDLERFIEEKSLTVDNVRAQVDDYSLLSYYLGVELELNTRYSSPLREGDDNPSFSIFYGYVSGNCKARTDRLYFKDQAGIGSGDVYCFLKLYLKAKSITEVLEQINYDLQLGLNGDSACRGLKPTILKETPIIKERPEIRIVSQPPTKAYINYWKKYDINEHILMYYGVHCVQYIHYVTSSKTSIITPRTLCIAYNIGKYYKLYQPLGDKNMKFRNNFPSNYIEGHLQIDWTRNDLLIITKSLKECMLFRQHWNIQSVSGKSETTMISPEFMNLYLTHFKRVVLWLDPDRAGCESTEKYVSLYPSLEVAKVPSWVEQKDPTDIYEVLRLEKTTNLIKRILLP